MNVNRYFVVHFIRLDGDARVQFVFCCATLLDNTFPMIHRFPMPCHIDRVIGRYDKKNLKKKKSTRVLTYKNRLKSKPHTFQTQDCNPTIGRNQILLMRPVLSNSFWVFQNTVAFRPGRPLSILATQGVVFINSLSYFFFGRFGSGYYFYHNRVDNTANIRTCISNLWKR